MDFDKWGQNFKAHPVWTGFKALLIVGIPLIIITTVLTVIGTTCGVAQEAAQIAKEELGPRALLRKYEWFKDASAQAEGKLASIAAYNSRIAANKKLYGASAIDWPRDVRQDTQLVQAEVAGAIASYNLLAAEYNAAMAKINYRFINVGGLPEGVTEPLPREFKPYKEGV